MDSNISDYFNKLFGKTSGASTSDYFDKLFGTSSNGRSIVKNASQYLGQPLDQGDCQAFVEQMTKGRTGIYPTAIDAWNSQNKQAIRGLEGIRPGDAIYFTPNHTGIYAGNNQFISATDNGVEINNVNDWSQKTGQGILGYIPQQNQSN